MEDDSEVTEQGSTTPVAEPGSGVPGESTEEWTSLLGYLLATRGFDFHGYKPASLERRIRKRMDSVGLDGFSAYQDYLEVHPNEFEILFNTILINVTSFFRDPAAWEAVRDLAIPAILSGKSAGEPIRVWSAGCATGEEAFTIAMLLAEALPSDDDFRDRVKIYATDIDDEALNSARHAAYNDKQTESVPPELRDKYFEPVDGLYLFRKDLRRQVIFGRHDLINDAPISRIDLLTCRNTLMYLNAETQTRVLARLHFALNEGGFLLLGRAETLMANSQGFASVDLKRRLSRKRSHGSVRGRGLGMHAHEGPEADLDLDTRMSAAALDASPVAQLLIDPAGNLALINERARTLFDIRSGELRRPFRDLQVSYRPLELRSLIDRADTERRPVTVKEVEWHAL